MTGFSRRRLMGAGLAAVAAGPLQALTAITAGATTAGASAVPTVGLARWQALVGQTFRVTGRGWRHGVVLRSAEALRRDPHLTGDGYILIFRGARHDDAPDAVCVLQHAGIGSFSAALLPVDQPTDTQSYQLIVDRRRPVFPTRR